MANAYICDGIRTPIGRFGGVLSGIRADDLGAIPIKALKDRYPALDWRLLDDVILGCANQAGEDNRDVARMSLLLAGIPMEVSGTTINRLCGSGMDAISYAARSIKAGEASLMIAGGVESMSRAPYVLSKPTVAFDRNGEMFDTTIGWRFINPLMQKQYGSDSMPETAENVARRFNISREDQDAFALRSQQRTQSAKEKGVLAQEITPVTLPQRKGEPLLISEDEHPRPETTLAQLSSLRAPFAKDGSVTAGNASGVNDGAAAVLMASAEMVSQLGLNPVAKVIATATVGVEPSIMGIGPAPAAKKALEIAGLSIEQMDVIELNEAFASQALAVLRELGLPDDAEHVNPNGGAIALGHPLGMSGTRLVIAACNELERRGGRYALCCMCIGVGQGIAMVIESV
ncbi:3-oxoadipyl-CoA thiolase [Vibrio cincinnatiensis]|uniref:3-oxoadipyl-CoA thiolase n=1 Tax=Vibrio cincinnatiensis TaxID=675 RepID=UPI0012AC8F2D|nr:3-oxoadipyl-CoA thiolase [Vibrio cincinnatiensis]MCG3766115.1 3-oxoadipyl-CoA thiolase [Vibrio cincinnatiensis]